jgi:hypothetical protein
LFDAASQSTASHCGEIKQAMPQGATPEWGSLGWAWARTFNVTYVGVIEEELDLVTMACGTNESGPMPKRTVTVHH